MTEPIDESELAPDQTAAPAGEAPPEAASTAWVAPSEGGGGGRRTRGCLIVAIVAAVLLVVGYFGLVFLGGQVESVLAGTIEFGTGGTGCSVTGGATTFPTSSAFHSVAYFERDTRPGETITTTVTYPNGTKESQDQTFDETGKCIAQDVPPGLAPGHYGLEYRSGTEVLAKGEFDITP
jgi:hypothetical protein